LIYEKDAQQLAETEQKKYENNVIIEPITDMIENVLLNVKQRNQYVEMELLKAEKTVMTDEKIEQQIVKTTVQSDVQQTFLQPLYVEMEL
jgi:hypothetical protein